MTVFSALWNKILIIILLSLAACAPQHRLTAKDIRPLHYSSGPGMLEHVQGLREALKRSPSAPVRILVVHGMITNQTDYSERLQKNLTRRLGLVVGREEASKQIPRGYDITVFSGPQPFGSGTPLSPSSIKVTTWVYPDKPEIDRVIFYEVLWAPLRDELKNLFFACFESRSVNGSCIPFNSAKKNSDHRHILNGYLKDDLMINGFGDATIVLSEVGNVLRDDMRLALCNIARDVAISNGFSGSHSEDQRCSLSSVAPTEETQRRLNAVLSNVPFFALTHSLGSFLVMDGQQQFAQNRATMPADKNEETSMFYLFDHAIVYMRANQLALLQLSRLSAFCTPGKEGVPCPNRLLPEKPFSDGGLQQMTTYVAFNDIDDALGFEMPPYLPDTGLFGALVNVSVKNPGWSIPFFFKSPSGAHLNSDDNPAVIRAITDGIDLNW